MAVGGPKGLERGPRKLMGSWEADVMPCPSTTTEFKKSFENDSQSSDNINFLKVQWSSRQLPTVRRGWGLTGWVLGEAAGRENPTQCQHPISSAAAEAHPL